VPQGLEIEGRSGVASEELGLASVLEALHDELESAWKAGQGRPVRFRATEVTLTLETVARLDKEGSGKIRWYVLEAGAALTSGSERSQTLTLTLTPTVYDDNGQAGPLDVAGKQAAPGQ
jgi:NTP-dependent ternary system trypsin peptidase co-occuring protein